MGNGDAWASLRALAEQLRLEDYVWFTGQVHGDELSRYLSAADICVDPDPANAYNNRSTMIKIMEYMAFEKPIVAFDLPEHRVTAKDAAVYVTPNDEHAFAVALAGLMDDAVARKVMGTFGRRRIEAELAWRFSVSNLLEVYRKVLPNSRVATEPVPPEANEPRPRAMSSRQAAV